LEILRIIKGTASTSAGLNNFIYTRSKLDLDERQTYLELFDYDFPKNSSKFNFISANNSYIRLTIIVLKWIRKTVDGSVIHVHSPSLILFTIIGKYLSLKEIPILFSIHNNKKNYSFIQKILIIIGFLFANRVVFVSSDSFRSFNKGINKRITSHKSLVITNGTDFDKIRLFRKFHYKKNCKKIISVSRLVKQKNIFFMIDVFSKVDFNFELNIYGAGYLHEELEQYIKSKNLEHSIRLHMPIKRENFYKRLREHDLYISTSNWEGMPQALIEAAGMGLPCIVSSIPPHLEIAQKAKHVECCKSSSLDFWVNNLNNFCKNYSKNVPINDAVLDEFYLSKFSSKQMHLDYQKAYKSMLSNK